MKLFDSHIHLNSLSIKGWEEDKDWIFNNISTTPDDCRVAIQQSQEHSNVYVTVGVHPLEINDLDITKIMDWLDWVVWQNRSKVVAMGETGLDFYRANKEEAFEKQQRWLYAHYGIAKKYNLPLVIHVRNAHEELLEILETVLHWRGVIHCYEGTEEIAERYLSLPGEWVISVSPIIFRDGSKFRNFVHKLDLNKLLVESDAPYLGKDHLVVNDLVKIIAEEKGISIEECQTTLWNNFCRVFNLNIE